MHAARAVARVGAAAAHAGVTSRAIARSAAAVAGARLGGQHLTVRYQSTGLESSVVPNITYDADANQQGEHEAAGAPPREVFLIMQYSELTLMFIWLVIFAVAAPMSTSWKGVKRFYTNVTVAKAAEEPPYAAALATPKGGAPKEFYQVLVDGRALRTHATNELYLPSRSLALAIAAEFGAQGEMIMSSTTPLYNLASLAIDTYATEDVALAEDLEAEARAGRLATFDRILAKQLLDERRRAKEAGEKPGAGGSSSSKSTSKRAAEIMAAARAAQGDSPSHARTLDTGRNESGAFTSGAASGTSKLRDLLLDYLETDSVCYRVDWDMADPGEKLLRKRQDKYYEPLLEWFHGGYGVKLATAVGFDDVNHPDAAYIAVEDIVDGADPFAKAALQHCVGTLKSTVLTLALLHRHIDVEGAFDTSRVEEEWQIDENGFVEDGHDTARVHSRVQLAAAASFLWMLPGSGLPALPVPGSKDYEQKLNMAVKAREARVAARRAREKALVAQKREAMKRRALEEAAAEEEDKRAAALTKAALGGPDSNQ